MYYTGFADEASNDFSRQIAATKELGWTNIESRAIGDGNLSRACPILGKFELERNC